MARAIYGNRPKSPFGPRAAASNPTPSGVPQGTPGGKTYTVMGAASSTRKNRGKAGDEIYLWFLVLVEVMLIAGCRHIFFRAHHGG